MTISHNILFFCNHFNSPRTGTQAFQECPAIELTRTFTKWSHLVTDVNSIESTIDRAFHIALSGKPGVVHLDMPKDILSSIVAGRQPTNTSSNTKKIVINSNTGKDQAFDDQFKTTNDTTKKLRSAQVRVTDPLTSVPGSCQIVTSQKDQINHDSHIKQNVDSSNSSNIIDDWSFSKIVGLINKAKQPVIIAGKGCNTASTLLREFAITGNIPVTTTLHAMGCFDETHPLALQMLGMFSSLII